MIGPVLYTPSQTAPNRQMNSKLQKQHPVPLNNGQIRTTGHAHSTVSILQKKFTQLSEERVYQ